MPCGRGTLRTSNRNESSCRLIHAPGWTCSPLATAYGLTPNQIHRTIGTVERILEVDRRQQALAVGLLSTGIVVGFLTDLAETLAR